MTSTDDNERGNFPCGRGNCQICNVLKPSKEFKSIVTGKTDKMNLHFDSNSLSAVCLISCKMCKNSKLGQQIQNSEHRLINLSQTWNYIVRVEDDSFRKNIKYLFNCDHNGSYKDILVQIIDFCDPNDRSGKTWGLPDTQIINTLSRVVKFKINNQ